MNSEMLHLLFTQVNANGITSLKTICRLSQGYIFIFPGRILTSPPLFQYCVDAQTTGDCEGSSHVCPAGHGEQNDAPLSEYVPKGHA